MIYPSIEELTKGKYNRYELVIATAKCARLVTDEYMKQRETAEKLIADKQTDRYLAMLDSYLSFREEFPESKYMKKVEKMAAEARDYLDRTKTEEAENAGAAQ